MEKPNQDAVNEFERFALDAISEFKEELYEDAESSLRILQKLLNEATKPETATK